MSQTILRCADACCGQSPAGLPRCQAELLWLPLPQSHSSDQRLLKVTKQQEQCPLGKWGCVAKCRECTHPSTLQDWATTVHAFTTRKQTAGFYNWNVGLCSHLLKSEPLELGDKMSITILQPICPLQLQFFMTSIQVLTKTIETTYLPLKILI